MSASPDLNEFQTSAAYISAIARALEKLGQLTPVLAKAEPGAAQMLRAPHTQRWWGGPEAFAMTDAVVAVGGTELVKRVGQLAVTESISVIVRPLVGVVLAISGPSPATLFARFGQLSQAAIKNVKLDWHSTGDTSGDLRISYPLVVPQAYPAWWLGGIDFVWATTKRAGTTKATHHGTALDFALSWE